MIPPTEFCQEWLDSLVGESAIDVQANVKVLGEAFRVTRRDGFPIVCTRDYRPCRLSVEIEAGLITKACFG